MALSVTCVGRATRRDSPARPSRSSPRSAPVASVVVAELLTETIGGVSTGDRTVTLARSGWLEAPLVSVTFSSNS